MSYDDVSQQRKTSQQSIQTQRFTYNEDLTRALPDALNPPAYLAQQGRRTSVDPSNRQELVWQEPFDLDTHLAQQGRVSSFEPRSRQDPDRPVFYNPDSHSQDLAPSSSFPLRGESMLLPPAEASSQPLNGFPEARPQYVPFRSLASSIQDTYTRHGLLLSPTRRGEGGGAG